MLISSQQQQGVSNIIGHQNTCLPAEKNYWSDVHAVANGVPARPGINYYVNHAQDYVAQVHIVGWLSQLHGTIYLFGGGVQWTLVCHLWLYCHFFYPVPNPSIPSLPTFPVDFYLGLSLFLRPLLFHSHSFSLHTFIHIHHFIFIYLSVCLSLSLSVSVCLSASASVSLIDCLFGCHSLPFSAGLHLSVSLYVCLSVCLFCICVCLPHWLSQSYITHASPVFVVSFPFVCMSLPYYMLNTHTNKHTHKHTNKQTNTHTNKQTHSRIHYAHCICAHVWR